MRYGDLIQYEPLRTVIELRKADRMERELVSTYVISDEMADKMRDPIIQNLQFETPADNKGVLVVGNYGTGKSHLMSVVSAVAEHAELAELLSHPAVREAAAAIAGRFKVVRVELSTTAALRDVLCRQLERALAEWGVEYVFPPQDQVANNKEALEAMMEAFHQRFPDRGLLLVVDELLDFLRHRMHQGDAGIILDLGFLREMGEIAADLPFRFVGGVQVSLFDNPEFQFVADSLRRVQARFRQAIIGKKDVQFVVSERLLRKTAEQKVKIREHLLPFAKFYEGMNERMDEFVRLFPVHPDYVGTFEKITVAEQREILKTISSEAERLSDREVPADQPGVLAFERYWSEIRENAAFRANPEIRTVLDASTKLEELVEAGYPKGKNKALARRIVHGLSIHRLTVGNIEAPVGMTAEQLRDQLCLFDPLVAELGGDPAEDLRGEIETALRLISRTVNGQFISATERDARGGLGGQFYLDVRKTVDYDAQIDRRASTLSEDVFDRRYFEALTIALERKDQPTVATGYKIWEYELTWRERNASRLGYLVLGAPNDRNTAHPPRDFYLYFLQLYRPPRYQDEKRLDEVFFELTGADEAFRGSLTRYAAAMDLASTSAGNEKATYQRKADQYLRELVRWLQDNMLAAVEVIHQGRTKKLLDWVQGRVRERLGIGPSETANVRDVINLVASTCLAPAFEEQAPDYPQFSILITARNREQAAQEAIRWFRGGTQTKQATAVLDALELLDGDQVVPERSRYASHIRQVLQQKQQGAAGQVANRAELIGNVRGVEYMSPDTFRLEPEWVAVLLAALVYNGDVVLAIPGRKFNAGDLDALASTPVADLVAFKHLEPPKEWNVAVLRALFELVGENPGQANQIAQGSDAPVGTLQAKLRERVHALVQAQQLVQGGLPFWGRELLSDQEKASYREQLGSAKTFLESLQSYTTAAKLKNLRVSADESAAQKPALDRLEEINALQALTTDLSPTATYLAQAAVILPPDHPWVSRARDLEKQVLARVTDAAQRSQPQFRTQVLQELESLKADYVQAYAALHPRARLGVGESRRRTELLNDPRLRKLNALATIQLTSEARLREIQEQLGKLQECSSLTEQELLASPFCSRCGYRPANEPVGTPAAAALDAVDERIDELLESWTRTLREALEDPMMQSNLELLSAEQRREIERFAKSGELPSNPETVFVPAMRDVLAGLTRVVARMDELRTILTDGGAATKPQELRDRFDAFLTGLLKGKDPSRVRVVVE
ncbi:MAG: ATP-binding protein [Gemmatimonadetes bacterium]|jgi:energy-coupling factor transporter ATP-binding protein EcfA2|nr:ATP-binding protein [Gemmatimonadota bacterium]